MRERERVRYVAFVTARYGSLYRTAYLLTAKHHDAEDVVQAALAKVYVSWARVSRVDHPEAYARRVLVNEVISSRRRFWTREVSSDRPFELARTRLRGGAAEAGPEQGVVDAQVVWQALAKLTARQRAVVVLRYYEDLSEAQIAAALNVAPGTVKGHAHAALVALRAALPASRAALNEQERA